MPRRKTALEGLQKKGPTLVFDAGNALFQFPGKPDDALKPRARFILETMGKLGVKVMAAGPKDIGPGATWLKQTAAKAGVKVLSANLREKGQPVFDGSAVVEANGVKVGFVAVTSPNDTAGLTAMTADPLIPAVRAELAKLKGKADLTVLLSACSAADTMQLSQEFKAQLDFVVTSGEMNGMTPAQRNDGAWIVTGGQRGQALAQLVLELDGKGAWVDLSEIAREKEQLDNLDAQLVRARESQKKAIDPESKKLWERTLTELQQRRAEQKKRVDVGVKPDARTFDYTFVVLNDTVVDEPALKTEVLKYEPTYAGAH